MLDLNFGFELWAFVGLVPAGCRAIGIRSRWLCEPRVLATLVSEALIGGQIVTCLTSSLPSCPERHRKSTGDWRLQPVSETHRELDRKQWSPLLVGEQ